MDDAAERGDAASRLIGRKNEIARIRDLVTRLAGGRGSVIVLLGEHGIGKSTLLREAIAMAGRTVSNVRGMHVPAGILQNGSVTSLTRIVSSGYPFDAPVATGILDRMIDSDGAVALDDPEVLRAAIGIARQASAERPMILTAEDVPLEVEGLFTALTSLAAAITSMPVLVVVTASHLPGTAFESSPAGSLWVHHVPPLTPDEAARLVRAHHPQVPNFLAHQLGQLTDGNPGDVLEVCDLLDEDQCRAASPLPDPLPGTQVSSGIYRPWWNGLDAQQRSLVLCAAVALTPKAELLEATSTVAVGDVPGPDGRSVLRHGADRIVFNRPRLRSAVLAVTPFHEVRQAHRTLAAHAADGTIEQVWHSVESGATPSPGAAALMEREARIALDEGELSRTLRLVEAALKQAEPGADLAGLPLLGGVAASFAGYPGHALPLLSAALTLATDSETLHRAATAFVLTKAGWDRAVPLTRAGAMIARLTETSPDAAASLACLVARLCCEYGDDRSAEELLQLAERLAGDLAGDTEPRRATATNLPDELDLTRAVVLRSQGHRPPALMLTGLGQPAPGIDVADWERSLTYVALLIRDGRWQEGRAGLLDLQQATRRYPASWAAAWTASLTLEMHLSTWDLHGAQEIVAGSVRATPLHVVHGGIGLCVVARTLVLLGRDEEAGTWLDEAARLARQSRLPALVAEVARVRGMRSLLGGRNAEAAAHLNEALAGHTLAADTLTSVRVAAAVATYRAHGQGDTSVPLRMDHPDATPPTPRTDVNAPARFASVVGPLLDAPHDDVVALAEEAADMARSLPYAGQEAAVLELAEAMLGAVGADPHSPQVAPRTPLHSPGSTQERRLTLLRRARERYRAAGASAFVAALDDRIAATTATTTDRPAVDGARLTDEERRIATLVYRGASNKEVAGSLYLSVRTVELRLTHIYRKLGIGSRRELRQIHALGDPTAGDGGPPASFPRKPAEPRGLIDSAR
ncbi:LuxR family transcriptional regulator [Georgenia sp. SYP-B2076]|uniref:helix-turn-helix transcriptional regulator n=1 Tax=Georgenia sp. SYP-B2076 TaxID=2495881 RepID=UPI000F8F7134|nr:LuxR family transcriptional regulator [Georgenia sp. SYP-B2076]